jgi:predicted nucleotidyltransferase
MTIDRKTVHDICARNDIVRLRLFGSYATGEETPESDVDLIADFSDRKSLLDLVRIEREFSERLGRKVDLLTENALSPYLREVFSARPRSSMSSPRDDSVFVRHIE